VELLGVLTGQEAESNDGVLVDSDQATSLSDATPFSDVSQNFDHLGFRQASVEQWGSFSLGEPGFAGLAVKQATLMGTISRTNSQIASTSNPVVGAVRVLAAEPRQVVRVHCSSWLSQLVLIAVVLVYKSGNRHSTVAGHQGIFDPVQNPVTLMGSHTAAPNRLRQN